MKQPLAGKKILVTREAFQAREFSKAIKEVGGDPIEAPLIKITCNILSDEQQEQLHTQPYSWVFFTSANGVRCFFSQSIDVKKIFETARIAAVGSKTAKALETYGYRADFVPPVFDAETMVDAFKAEHEHVGRWLLIRGNLSKKTIPLACENNGIPYDIAEVYETRLEENQAGRLQNVLAKHQFDFITFTSPSTVDSFCLRIQADKFPTVYTHTNIICIGNTTKKRAIEAGFTHVQSAHVFTTRGMIEKMIDIEKEGNVRND